MNLSCILDYYLAFNAVPLLLAWPRDDHAFFTDTYADLTSTTESTVFVTARADHYLRSHLTASSKTEWCITILVTP